MANTPQICSSEYGKTEITEGENAERVFMMHNFENTESWEDIAESEAIAGWHRPPLYFRAPFSLHSPSINYTVCPFESFTLPL